MSRISLGKEQAREEKQTSGASVLQGRVARSELQRVCERERSWSGGAQLRGGREAQLCLHVVQREPQPLDHRLEAALHAYLQSAADETASLLHRRVFFTEKHSTWPTCARARACTNLSRHSEALLLCWDKYTSIWNERALYSKVTSSCSSCAAEALR